MVLSLLKKVVALGLLAPHLLTSAQAWAEEAARDGAATATSASVVSSSEVSVDANAMQALLFHSPTTGAEAYPEMRSAIAAFQEATACQVRLFSYLETAKPSKGLMPILNNFTQEAMRKPLISTELAVVVAWTMTADGQYVSLPAVMYNQQVREAFTKEAIDAFSSALESHSDTVAQVKDTRADKVLVAALEELQKGVIPPLSYNVESIKTAAKEGITSANDARGNKTETACNYCVRAAIWHLAISSVLFPNHGAFIGVHNASSYLYGRTSQFDTRYPNNKDYIGNANSIAATLAKAGEVPEFIAIPNMANAKIPDFKQLQGWANAGQIIVGVLKKDNESGHIVMMVPGSNDLTKDGEQYDYRKIINGPNAEVLMPQILECGGGRREENISLQWGVNKDLIYLMKWYKMIGTYTSEKNKIK